MSPFLDLGAIFAEAEREGAIERKWLDTTPKVLVKTPSIANRNETRIRLDRLGNLRAFELTTPGPRGGKGKTTRHFDGGAGGWQWKSVDVRLADEPLLAKVDEIDAKIKALEEEKRAYLRERFLELPLVTWEEVVAARDPWKAFRNVYDRAKKGEASVEDVKVALEALLKEAKA